MSNHFLNVYDEHNLIVDPALSPETGGKLWEPARYTDSDATPMLVGIQYGQKIRLSGAGPNDGAILTSKDISDNGGTPGIEVLETLSAPDAADYDFQLIRSGIGVPPLIEPPAPLVPNVFGVVTDYDMNWADITYWPKAGPAGSNVVVTKETSFIGGEGLCLRVEKVGATGYACAVQSVDVGGLPGYIDIDIYCRSVDGVAYPRLYINGWIYNGTTSTSAQHFTKSHHALWGGPPLDIQLFCEGIGAVEFDLVKVSVS